MARTFETQSDERFFLWAAVMATVAAAFMVTVWGPLQMRALKRASEMMQAQAAPERAMWLQTPFTTADGATTSLESSNGQVRVVTMMYTHCPGVCPLALATLQAMENRLNPTRQAPLSFVALSLDPDRDTLARLREFRSERGLDPRRWTVGRPSPEGVRQLASGLGVEYRLLSDDSVDHQSAFVLLSKSGEVLARSSSTHSVDPRFLSALQAALATN